eukprot:gene18081-biopygen14460
MISDSQLGNSDPQRQIPTWERKISAKDGGFQHKFKAHEGCDIRPLRLPLIPTTPDTPELPTATILRRKGWTRHGRERKAEPDVFRRRLHRHGSPRAVRLQREVPSGSAKGFRSTAHPARDKLWSCAPSLPSPTLCVCRRPGDGRRPVVR